MNPEINDLIEKEEAELAEYDDSSETPPSDIVAFNELRSCADLKRMHDTNQLIIKPDFQRDVVWSNPSQTRFIDSLVKQLPIPSMCLSLDYKTEKRLMIDGLQRISSIIRFLQDDNWRLSTLDDIDTRISGKTAGYIKKNNFDLYSRIENLTIPVTVLRCDYSKKTHTNYLFTIFHRLNTGGNKLNNQEIRNCIYSGSFNELLKAVVKKDVFVNIFSIDKEKSYRFSNEELILRVFAFSDNYENYNGKLAKFLNNYMDDNKQISEDEWKFKEDKMERVLNLFYNNILQGRPLQKLSKATTESILVGIYKNVDQLELENSANLITRYNTLRSDANFSVDSLSEGLSATDKVKSRIGRAVEIFS
ncbi:DUF262 domain-containing protein [Vibrio fluvialis]